MKLIDGIAISARDINRRKLRSILTIIAISVGSMLLVSMQGLGDTIRIILGTLGGILGCIFAIIAIYGINEYLIEVGKTFRIALTIGNILFGFIISLIISILAGVIPANKAAKLDVIETINEE